LAGREVADGFRRRGARHADPEQRRRAERDEGESKDQRARRGEAKSRHGSSLRSCPGPAGAIPAGAARQTNVPSDAAPRRAETGLPPYGVSALTSSPAGRMSSIRATPLPAYSGPESSRLGGPSAVGGPGPRKGWL